MTTYFLSVVDRIYGAAVEEADWSTLLNQIANVCHAEVAWLVLVAPDIELNTVIAPRSDPEIISNYLEHWWTKDVTLEATLTAPVGQLTSLGTIGRERFHASEFYNDFWTKSGHASERLAANLVTARGAMCSIGVQPKPRENCIDSETARTFAALVPHLVRCVEIRCKMRELEMERDLARGARAPGALLVDGEARPLVYDDAARAIVAENGNITFAGGKVVLRDRSGTASLHRMVASCQGANGGGVRGGRLSAFCEERGDSLHVEVLPMRSRKPSFGPELVLFPQAAAILILSDPTNRRRAIHEALQSRFGFTPAEAAVALELLRADGRQAAADRLGVSLATVRTHMMRIFEKAGAKSQAALVMRMAEAGVAVNLPPS